MSDKIDYDKLAAFYFADDLKAMSDAEIERERNDVQERVDEQEQWLEALAAEQRIRARPSNEK